MAAAIVPAYLVTDRSEIKVLFEYTPDMAGWRKALEIAATLAQLPEMFPSGITIERRVADGSIVQVITITKA